jgi:hypothetical protein
MGYGKLKNKIVDLVSDKLHPVPLCIPPGSYTYYLFKARFQYDTHANIRAHSMMRVHEVSNEEQARANQLLDMYEAGYKAGQCIK